MQISVNGQRVKHLEDIIIDQEMTNKEKLTVLSMFITGVLIRNNIEIIKRTDSTIIFQDKVSKHKLEIGIDDHDKVFETVSIS